MTLRELADELIEIRRYVRSNPILVDKTVTRLEDDMQRELDVPLPDAWTSRLATNLLVGRQYIHTDPELLEAYLFAAAFEIRDEANERQERDA